MNKDATISDAPFRRFALLAVLICVVLVPLVRWLSGGGTGASGWGAPLFGVAAAWILVVGGHGLFLLGVRRHGPMMMLAVNAIEFLAGLALLGIFAFTLRSAGNGILYPALFAFSGGLFILMVLQVVFAVARVQGTGC